MRVSSSIHFIARAGTGRGAQVALALLCCTVAVAQVPEVTNVAFTQQDDGAGGSVVVITYDLVSPNGPCDISVLLARDGDLTGDLEPVSSVTGDLEDVSTGTGYTIRWDIGADYPEETMPSAVIVIEAEDASRTYEEDLATLPERAANHGFPRLAVQCQRLWRGDEIDGFQGREFFKRLYWYDYAIVDGNAVANDHLSPTEDLYQYLGHAGPLRAKNPNLVVVGYFSPADFWETVPEVRWNKVLYTYAFGPTWDPFDSDRDGQCDTDPSDNFVKESWLFKTTSGAYVDVYPFDVGIYSKLQDPNQPGMRERFVETFNDLVVSREAVDGIYYDWAFKIAPNVGLSDPIDPEMDQRMLIDLDGDGVSDVCPDGDALTDPSCMYELDDPVNVHWRTGMLALFQLCRTTFPQHFLQTGNAGWFNWDGYADELHGSLIEGLNDAVRDSPHDWRLSMYTYASSSMGVGGAPQGPRFPVLMSHSFVGPDDNAHMLFDLLPQPRETFFSATQHQAMRFTLASALMFDGYYACSNPEPHNAAWWLDEFAVDAAGHSVYPQGPNDMAFMSAKGWLGAPSGDGRAYNVATPSQKLWDLLQLGVADGNTAHQHVWRRNFENGIVLVNPKITPSDPIGLGGTYRRIQGELDPAFNNGAQETTVTLPPQSGIVLIGPVSEGPARF